MSALSHRGLSFDDWRVGGVASSGPNTRGVAVRIGGGLLAQPPKIQLCCDDEPPLEILEVSEAAEDFAPVILRLRVPESSPLVESLGSLDRFALGAAADKSLELFKKQFQPAQLEQLLRPCLDQGPSQVLSLALSKEVRVWRLLGPSEAPRGGGEGPHPVVDGCASDLVAGSKVWVCATATTVTFQPRSFGLTLSATDVLVIPSERPEVFPFVSRLHSFSYAPQRNALGPSEPTEVEEARPLS